MDLVIVGNGFDIAHGLPTRYADFMKYLTLYSVQPKVLYAVQYTTFIDKNSICEEDQARHNLYDKLIKYIPMEDLWSDFEYALGIIDIDQIKEDNHEYMLSYSDDNWSESAHHDYQYMISKELDFTKDVEYWFYYWIASINTHVMQKTNILDMISAEDLFLNFNYTDTLETTYNIPETQICYIHGKATNSEKLVLGHHNDVYDNKIIDTSGMNADEYEAYMEDISGYDVRDLKADEVISSYFKRTFKDTKEIIRENSAFFLKLQNVENIYILGHSLSDIDMDYFRVIKSKVKQDCQWNISCYDQSALTNALNFAKMLSIQNLNLISI